MRSPLIDLLTPGATIAAVVRKYARALPYLLLCQLCSTTAGATEFAFAGVESVFLNPPTVKIRSFAIVIASGRNRIATLPQEYQRSLQGLFVYQTRVKIDNQVYYRLAIGNYDSMQIARRDLQLINRTFADAWIYRRSPEEESSLARFVRQPPASDTTLADSATTSASIPEKTLNPAPAVSDDAESLLKLARNEFIDDNYTRVIAITDRIILTGGLAQVREALELAGLTRERQGKYTQAIKLYEALLDTQPTREVEARVRARLEGIHTMSLRPKSRIPVAPDQPEETRWTSSGIFQQYYLNDVIDLPNQDPYTVNSALFTDVDMVVQRQTDRDKLEFHLDAGLVTDFHEGTDETRVSSASIGYGRDTFSLIAGRQNRTLTGIYGRFDGLSFRDLSHSGYQLSYAYGYPVQSPFDDVDSDQSLLAANLDFAPNRWLEVNLFLVQQQVDGLTDRQAVGGEIQYLDDDGYFFGFIDYDIFYDALNTLSLTLNQRISASWSLNFSLSGGYSPTLSTLNALQGQAVDSISELQSLYSNSEIYDFARDRASRSASLSFGATYQIDSDRYLYANLSGYRLDGTEASGGVEGIDDYDDVQLLVDYSFQGFLLDKDYATLGMRLSDSTNSEIVSVRARTQFNGYGNLIYQPGMQLDRRTQKDNEITQLILRSAIQVQYRISRTLSFEGDFAFEYSDFDLPDVDNQYSYSTYIGYTYLF